MTVRLTVPGTGDADEREVVAARLWAAGALGVWDQPGELVAWFDEPVDLDGPWAIVGTWAEEPEHDWQASWKAGIEPVVAGDVAIVPSWLRDQAPSVAHVIELDPGQAFGTGHHATTVLCLELLQGLALDGRRVLDVGTGTGVLAIAAAMLGASVVTAVDIDRDAVEVARTNAARNDVPLDLSVGSVDAAAGGNDVVLANLLTDTVTRLAAALLGALTPTGTLIASGITVERAAGPRRALEAAGGVIVDERHRDGWVGLAVRRTT